MLGWIFSAFLLGVLVMIPCFPDPYHKKKYLISFCEWLYKELDELINGEK